MFVLEAQLELDIGSEGEKRSDEVLVIFIDDRLVVIFIDDRLVVIFIDERNEGTQKTRSLLEKE